VCINNIEQISAILSAMHRDRGASRNGCFTSSGIPKSLLVMFAATVMSLDESMKCHYEEMGFASQCIN